MRIKVVAFDLDDTLYNATELARQARINGLNAMINKGLKIDLKKAILILDEIVNEYGTNNSRHYNIFIRRINRFNPKIDFIPADQKNKFVSAAVMAYHAQKIKLIKPFRDVIPGLKQIKELGIKTAIISDGIPIKQYEKILRLGIDELIDLVVISDEIGVRKPNPKLFEYFLKKFGINGEDSLYVGDNLEKDLIPARKNEIHSVYIHRGGKYDNFSTGKKIIIENKPDYEIKSLLELKKIIKEINSQ
jgi:putative hydrolase of the HAD superfamily